MSDTVLLQRDGAIVAVVPNNPQKLNALSLAMWTRLGVAMHELEHDDSVRANAKSAKSYGDNIEGAMRAVAECRHPTVAMIHGVRVGGGLEIASQCALRICGASSRFGIPIKKLGRVVGYGEMAALIGLVGRALEILLEGRVFGAIEAKKRAWSAASSPKGRPRIVFRPLASPHCLGARCQVSFVRVRRAA